jgi:hypothetical protein
LIELSSKEVRKNQGVIVEELLLRIRISDAAIVPSLERLLTSFSAMPAGLGESQARLFHVLLQGLIPLANCWDH